MSREIVISISNWDKYNPRKDLKSMPWIRLQGDIAFSESLFGLDAEAKWLWIFLLSYSTKKLSGDFKISEKYLSHHSGVSASKFNKYLGNFLDNGLISIKSNTSRITNESVRITNESVSNERTNETNITNITNPSDPISSDEFEDGEIDSCKKTSVKEMCQDVAELWNEMASLNALPKVKLPLSKDRIEKMKPAITEFKEYSDWLRIVNGVIDNDYNLGVNDRKWKANFDWLFRTTKFNYRKLWESHVE